MAILRASKQWRVIRNGTIAWYSGSTNAERTTACDLITVTTSCRMKLDPRCAIIGASYNASHQPHEIEYKTEG